jgi:hypothetical protein
MKTAYDHLAICPNVIAEQVVNSTYTGREMSNHVRDSRLVAEVERIRSGFTEQQKSDFIAFCDNRCRKAYELEITWFMECVSVDGDSGRDQLYAWINHWLAGFAKIVN